ncbi:polysaccharide pyruvyl transferase family protein [Aureimonas altamirensis]|uniref:polysaccharide pyruvyl transferase family protein n=1 Tax=Aureimonas altamirensis TaxID=370622 RepID=UPI00301867B5
MTAQLMKSESFMNAIHDVDAVVVNGEGTIHHNRGLHLLTVLNVAQKMGKATILVNAVYEQNDFYLDTLKKLDFFSVREQRSASFAARQGIECQVILDSCLSASYEQNPLCDLSNMVVYTDWHSDRDQDVGEALVSSIIRGGDASFFLPFERQDAGRAWARVPATIKTCAEFVTARHHGAYFAIAAKTPFVALGSNTLKLEGLVETLNFEMPIASDISQLDAARTWVRANSGSFCDLFARVEQLGMPDPFSALGYATSSDTSESAEVGHLHRQINERITSINNGEWYTHSASKAFKAAVGAASRLERRKVENALEAIYASSSWRVTAPIRFLKNKLK